MNAKLIRVEKHKADVYKIRHDKSCVWGNISVEFGKTSAQIMINSDYGSYAYNWFSTGENPKQFLCDINMDYGMEKLSDYKLYEPDTEKYSEEIKEKVIDARKGEYLTKEQAREAWNDMLGVLDDYPSGDIMRHQLIEHKYFNEVFGDFECLPSATRVMPKHKHFWEKIWTPFVEELKKEIEKEKVSFHKKIFMETIYNACQNKRVALFEYNAFIESNENDIDYSSPEEDAKECMSYWSK